MPEGDTLWRAATALRPRLLNHRVERAEPALLHRVEGSVVTEVSSYGKNLLIRFDSGHTLRCHLRMTGSWRVLEPGRQPQGRPPSALVQTEAGLAVFFDAPTVELTRTGAERTGGLGPDLLSPDLDVDLAVRRARTLDPETPVGVLLLDQRVAAGIGNIHRCELLWAAAVDPWTPQRELEDSALRALYDSARRGLARGTRPGRRRHAVHGRAGRPCPRCGGMVAARNQAQGEIARLTYWCPTCQVRRRPSS